MKKKIYAVLTMLIGIASIVAACTTTSDIRAKSDWPSVEGKVLERRLDPGRRAWRREPVVVYEFAVGGKTYKNDQVYMLPHTDGDEADMKAVIDSIPDRTEVFYDEDDPTQSYLIASSKLWFYILLPVGIVLILVGLVMVAGVKPDEPVRGT